jgi:hypothetical protein
MKDLGRVFWLILGLAVGISATIWFHPAPQPVWAGNDRHEDYIMATGSVVLGNNVTADGIWLLDYRAGKLLGTIVDPMMGKVVGWAEVDLVKEFNIPPKQNVHFMMTTGSPIGGNPALPMPLGTGGPPLPTNPPGGNPKQMMQGAGAGRLPGAQGTVGGHTALYLTEINTGRFGVYTMAPAVDGTGRMIIRKHDATLFRQPAPQQ